MNIKNMIGVTNVLAIFNDLSEEAKQEVIKDLFNEGHIPSMMWQDAIKSKPPLNTPVYVKSGFLRKPGNRMAMWDGEVWVYIDVYTKLEHVSHFCLP